MTRIKICGITRLEDALEAVRLGVNAIGFVFADSPRRISSKAAREIALELPPFVDKVGVFVNEEISEIKELYSYCRLNYIQLHGDEDRAYIDTLSLPVIKAFRVKDDNILKQLKDFALSHFLLDTFDNNRQGGTGRSFDWSIAREARQFGRVILSGGLDADNIGEAIKEARPYAVDVSSGVERRPGLKDFAKMKKFVSEVYGAST